jgi:small-conductance mechanosensitive channel
METLRSLGVDCLVVFGGVAAVVALLRFGGAVLDALPMSRARRVVVGRVRPLLAATVIALYAVVASRWVLGNADTREVLAFLLVVVVAVAASWTPLRDAVEGIYLRLGKNLVAGDRIDVDGVRGRINRLGARAIVLETSDGELAVIPYRKIACSTFRRAPGDDHSAFHVFRVAIPATRTIPELKRAVHEAALLCHWSSTRRPPIVSATEDGELEITVFPVDANHVTEIERDVRRAVG